MVIQLTLKWSKPSNNDPKKVIFAIDAPEVIQDIIINLKELPQHDYHDSSKWQFRECTTFEQLKFIGSPDIILLYWQLPGEKPMNILRYIRNAYPDAHVAILVGDLNERVETYMEGAEDLGFRNFIIGADLPGEPPYTLDLAIKYTREQVERDTFSEPVATGTPRFKSSYIAEKDGKLGVVCAVKGGVGKTTSMGGLSNVTAKMGVDVVAADFDIGRSDLTKGFFKVDPSKTGGLDQLILRTITPSLLDGLLVPVNENLRLLPGPSDKFNFQEAPFTEQDAISIANALRKKADLVLVDMPSLLSWPWATKVATQADFLIVIQNQSAFSEQDCHDFGLHLATNGVNPKKIRLVINSYSPKLANPTNIQRTFAEGMGVPEIKIAAKLPHNWEEAVSKAYAGEVMGEDDVNSEWYKLATSILDDFKIHYELPSKKGKKSSNKSSGGLLSGLSGLFSKFKR